MITMAKQNMGPQKTLQYLDIDGRKSCDPEEWRAEAYRFGTERSSDTSNPPDLQETRLAKLHAERRQQKRSGQQLRHISISGTLSARAKMQPGKAEDWHGLVPEHLLSLPWIVVVHLRRLFDVHF